MTDVLDCEESLANGSFIIELFSESTAPPYWVSDLVFCNTEIWSLTLSISESFSGNGWWLK